MNRIQSNIKLFLISLVITFTCISNNFASGRPDQKELFNKSYEASLKYNFDHISTDQGLPQSTVVCILEDRQGYMWFGTYNGLCKYDGYKFKVFVNNPKDPESISNNLIWSLLEDKQGNIWIGTWNGGLNEYLTDKEIFVRYIHDPIDTSSISNNIVRCLMNDSHGNFWVGTDSGLNIFDYQNKSFRKFELNKEKSEKGGENTILSIIESKSGNLWIGTDAGLVDFDIKTSGYKRYFNIPNNRQSANYNGIAAIFENDEGNLWLGTWYGGLIFFDTETKSQKQYRRNPANSNSLSNDIVTSISGTKEGKLWIGTRGGGIDIFTPENEQFTNISFNPVDPGSLSGNTIYSIYYDSDSLLWIGTDYNGLNKYDPHKEHFRSFSQNLIDKSSMPYNLVTEIFEDSKGRIWIGGNGGFSIYDRIQNKFTSYPLVYNSGYYTSGPVRTIREDKKGQFWIGSDGGGVVRFNPETGKSVSYIYNEEDKTSLSQDFIYSIETDHLGNVWIGTQNNGLNLYDPVKDCFIRYLHNEMDPWSITSNQIIYILEDSKRNLWIGTSSGGLNRFDRNTNRFSAYRFNSKDSTSISQDFVTSLHEDNKGNLWVGTMDKGLNCFNYITNKFKRYNTENGISNNRIFGILSDNKDKIWVSTDKGLNMLDRETGKIQNYYKSDGLAIDEFQIKSYFKSGTGELMFGGKQNLIIFNPDEITERKGIPRLAFTEVRLFNKTIPIGKMADGRVLLQKTINNTKEITFSYKDAVITFEFAVLHFAAPAENKYAYKMEGFEKDWNYVGNVHSATYTNLKAGKYIFRVIGSNCDNAWNNVGISLQITVTPPFWQTIWFKILLILFIIGLIILIVNLRVFRIKQQSLILEEKVIRRTHELSEKNQMLINQTQELNQFNKIIIERQQQIEELAEELISQKEELLTNKEHLELSNTALNESNAAKDKLFSIIAHDLRSPFNSLLGMTELLSINFDNWEKSKNRHFVNLLFNSAQQAYGLLDNLLIWARAQQHHVTFNPRQLSFSRMIINTIKIFETNSKDITIEYIPTQNDDNIFADEMMLDTVFRNLISNALKFTQRNGKIEIITIKNHLQWEVSVSDNGIGIPEELTEYIFKPHSYTTKGTEQEKGTGLGLLICKEFIEKHQGKIWFETEINKGTIFHFTIPLEFNH